MHRVGERLWEWQDFGNGYWAAFQICFRCRRILESLSLRPCALAKMYTSPPSYFLVTVMLFLFDIVILQVGRVILQAITYWPPQASICSLVTSACQTGAAYSKIGQILEETQ